MRFKVFEQNGGWHNSDDYNSGSYNSGAGNSGWYNSGSYNSGDGNSGDYNSGNCNSGYFNKCNNSSGVFCTKEPTIKIFNMDSDMTIEEFCDSKYYRAICSSDFSLTHYVKYKNMDEYLKTIPYKKACKIWWENMSEENKKIIMSMPNFDAAIFKEITGIKVRREDRGKT